MKTKRLLAWVLTLAMIISVLPMNILTVSAADAVSYISRSWNGSSVVSETKSVTSYTVVTSNTTTMSSGWYVVNSDVTVSSRITVSGSVNLILVDGCTLTASDGISLNAGNTLTVYGQTADTGHLSATTKTDTYGYAGICHL